MKNLMILIAALTLASPLSAVQAAPTATQASVMSDGVVRKVDAANGKITLKHGPIANLEMPGMTMVFRVKSAGLLKNIKAGDAVKFHAEDINGAFTVTDIQPAR